MFLVHKRTINNKTKKDFASVATFYVNMYLGFMWGKVYAAALLSKAACSILLMQTNETNRDHFGNDLLKLYCYAPLTPSIHVWRL